MKIVSYLVKYYLDILSFKTDRKIVVFLSDDWGSIRIKSQEQRKTMINLGIDLESNRFDKFDTLESNNDLEELFNVLLKYKDFNGNHPIISAITCMANPDFNKIKESEFSQYYYEPFIQTLNNYPNRDNVYNYYKKGIELGIFMPQLHGREHLNVKRWMRALKENDYFTSIAFENEYFFVPLKNLPTQFNRGFGAAFDIDSSDDVFNYKPIIEDSVKIFNDLFGFKPVFYVPPAQHYNHNIEPFMFENGICALDVPKLQKMPLGNNKFKSKLNYTGKKSKADLHYIVRNAVFEPNINNNSDGIDECMFRINNAFKNKQPAIISNHRAAFVGGLEIKNREKGIIAFDKLLSMILKKWSDVEFLSVSDIINLIKK